MSVFLGIDIGTSGTKTLAIRTDGEILADASATYDVLEPQAGWKEQNPDDWWRATVETVRAVMHKANLKPADVKAIGLSGQMHGSVFLDADDQVIRPALLWNDQRTAAECDEIERRAGGRERLIELVANPALTGFTAPKILWLRNNEPKNFERLRKVLLPKDEIRRRLTGEYATEVSDASGMLLLDVKNRTWSRELLGKLELDPNLFGQVYESEDVTGKLTKKTADELGLTTDCVVVGGAGDCAAGALGNGIVRDGVLNCSLGTSGVVFCYSDSPAVDPQGRLHTFCHAVRGKWHMMGVNLSCTDSFNWIIRQIAGGESKADFDRYTKEAASVPAGAESLLFLPYLSGERTPHADPHARGAFVGLATTHKPAHLVRAVLEGVTFNLRESLEIIRSLDVPVGQIRLTGGGSKSPLWRQIQAAMFQQPVHLTNAKEGAAYGVALLAAVGAGAYSSIQEACDATIQTTEATESDSSAARRYDELFLTYRQLYPALKETFASLAGLA
jgi:xylulokinase